MRIALRVYAYSMLVIAAAIGLLGLMSMVKYESILTETLAKRLTTVTDDARTSIEKAGTLGVPFNVLAHQVNGPIDAAAERLPADMRVAVIDQRGDDLRSDNKLDALPLPTATLVARIAAKEPKWFLRENGLLIGGSTVVNSFGQPEGAIVAVQSDRIIERRKTEMFAELLKALVLVAIPLAILAAVATYFSLRPLGHSIRVMRSVVDKQSFDQAREIRGPLAPTLHWFGKIFDDLDEQRGKADLALKEIEALAAIEVKKHGK